MPQLALTNASIRTILPGQVLWDRTVIGLHMRQQSEAGAKTFFLKYTTVGGTQRRPKLGNLGVITLDQARSLAAGMLLKVRAGCDPAGARAELRTSPTMADLWSIYSARHAAKTKTAAATTRLWKNHVRPRLGNLKVVEVGVTDARELHSSIRKPILANRVLALLSSMLSRAEEWQLRPVGSNPCGAVPRNPERSRRRYATSAEIERLDRELTLRQASSPGGVAFIRLLLLTGARCGEIEKARWEDLRTLQTDTGETVGVLDMADSKVGEGRVFFPAAAMRIVDALPRTSGTLTGVKYPRRAWESVRDAAGCADLRLHDLRHTFASVGLANGLSLSEIGGLLNHRHTQTTKRYAHLVDSHGHTAAGKIGAALGQMMNSG